MTRNMFAVFIIGLMQFFFSCSGKEQRIELSTVILSHQIRSDQDFDFSLPNGGLISVKNIENSNTTYLSYNSDSVQLHFQVTEEYLSRVMSAELPDIGDVIIIESYPVGASGLAANILNVSLIPFSADGLGKALSFNSFGRGADCLKLENDKPIVEVLDFVQQEEHYCGSVFALSAGSWVYLEEISCYTMIDGQLEKNHINKTCNPLPSPYAMPPAERRIF